MNNWPMTFAEEFQINYAFTALWKRGRYSTVCCAQCLLSNKYILEGEQSGVENFAPKKPDKLLQPGDQGQHQQS